MPEREIEFIILPRRIMMASGERLLPRTKLQLVQHAACDYYQSAQSPLVKDFFSHFDPKYDVPRPSHTKNWLTIQRVAFFMTRRVAMDGYLSFVFAFNEHVNELEQDPDKQQDFNYYELLQESFVYPIKSYIKAATFEWIAEGIRIAYAKVVHDGWNRRTAWKYLKGPLQSSLRKIARGGLSSLPFVLKSEARGQILPASANTTLRLLLHPWELRDFYFKSDNSLPVKAVHMAKYTAVEVGCLFARVVASGLGGLVGVYLGYIMYRTAGGEPGTGRWEQSEGGKDQSVPAVIFMPWALSCTVSDAIVSSMIRPMLEQALDFAQVDGNNHDQAE